MGKRTWKREGEREKKEISHPLAHSPNVCRPKPIVPCVAGTKELGPSPTVSQVH